MLATQPPAGEQPGLSHRIRSITVVGGFLDGAHFELTNGLNCFIGARGTGKTTALEFVRYALDSLPGREQPSERRRIESLVERNLAGGRVEVSIETKDGLSYIISRSVGEEPLVLTSERQPTATFKAASVFRADIYSQNEVESIADRTTSQLSLLDNFETERIAAVETHLGHIRSALVANASQIVPLESQIASLAEELATLASVEERLKKFSTSSGRDGETINQAHALKSLRDRENRIMGGTTQVLKSLAKDVSEFSRRVLRETTTIMDREVAQGPNAALIHEALEMAAIAGQRINRFLQDMYTQLDQTLEDVADIQISLNIEHGRQELEFLALIEKHQQAQGQAAERAKLERRRNELLAKRHQRQQLADQLAQLESERKNQLHCLSELWDQRFALRSAVARRINEQLSPSIRVSVLQFGNPERYLRLLEEGLKPARVKHLIVAQKLAAALCPAEFVVAIRNRETGLLMEKAELSSEQADKVVAAMSNSPLLFELETVELLDLPRIELRDGATYKDSLSLSTGQKCTAILPILLLDSDNPLLVDQPEDNLDNRFIFEAVVESIRKMKHRRQMIFVTHNPNIPVLGDAERVFVLDSDGASARTTNEGDVDQCKSDIVTLLEGGEDAFKARKCRYSY